MDVSNSGRRMGVRRDCSTSSGRQTAGSHSMAAILGGGGQICIEYEADVRKAWHAMVADIRNRRQEAGLWPWTTVQSATSSAILVLLEIGWKARNTGHWIAPEETAADVTSVRTNDFDSEQVAEYLAWHFRDVPWSKAQGCLMVGTGSEAPKMEAVSSKHEAVMNKGGQTEARPLECIISRSTWPGARLVKDKDRDGKCLRCTEWGLEAAMHRYWQCSANQVIEHQAVKRTATWANEAEEGS